MKDMEELVHKAILEGAQTYNIVYDGICFCNYDFHKKKDNITYKTAYFRGSVFKNCGFKNIDIRFTNFAECTFINCIFDNCDVVNCEFFKYKAQSLSFNMCNMKFTELWSN